MTTFLNLLDMYGLQRKRIREQESRPKAKIEIIYNYMFSFDQFMLERKSETKLVTETIWAKLWMVSKRFGLIMTISVQILFPNIKRIVEITKLGLTTVQFITHELFKVIVSNHWSEFDNFAQTADQMLTEILQMEDKYQFPNFPFISKFSR